MEGSIESASFVQYQHRVFHTAQLRHLMSAHGSMRSYNMITEARDLRCLLALDQERAAAEEARLLAEAEEEAR